MNINTFTFDFDDLLRQSAVLFVAYGLIVCVAIFALVVSFVMTRRNRGSVEFRFLFFVSGTLAFLAVLFTSVSVPRILDDAKFRVAGDFVVSSVEESYGVSLDNKAERVLKGSVSSALADVYGGVLPGSVSVKDFGLNWQSDKFTVKSDDGLVTTFLANDVDGETYLWVDKPDSKEKFVK